jgi:hypothetical protein
MVNQMSEKEKDWSLLEERKLKGYVFKLYDDDWGFLVKAYKDNVLVKSDVLYCSGANCVLEDEDLLSMVEED